jgi:hypothetical protein
MTPDVFICSAPEDRALAQAMCEFLEASDIKCWIAPRDISSTDEADCIAKGIEACRTMVLIFSASANESASVRGEVALAVAAHKVLICFGISQAPATGEMGPFLKHRFTIDAHESPLERLDLLARILKPLTHKLVPKLSSANTISGTLPSLRAVVRRADIPTLQSRVQSGGPLQVSLDFNHIVVVGHPSLIQVKVENQGSSPLHEIEVHLESPSLKRTLASTWTELLSGHAERRSLEIEPVRAGDFVLRVKVKCRQGNARQVFTASQSIRINEVPTVDLIARMKELLGTPEPETASPHGSKDSQSLRDLLKVALPELFEPLELSLDHEVSAEAEAGATVHSSLQIPDSYLGSVATGTILKLEPLGSSATVPYQEIRLVARPSFSLGRSGEESDYVAWFWPRNEVHDVKTRRISKKHCALALRGTELVVANAATKGSTAFEGENIVQPEGIPLGNGGVLDLSGIYFLEVARFYSPFPHGPPISNIDRWVGPRSSEPVAVGGSVRFLPVTPHVLPQNSTWLLTDATFGASRANGILLELQGFAEIQGRFHYHRSAFWLENFQDNGAVQLDGKNLEPGSIAPLKDGQTIQLGERKFRVTLQA